MLKLTSGVHFKKILQFLKAIEKNESDKVKFALLVGERERYICQFQVRRPWMSGTSYQSLLTPRIHLFNARNNFLTIKGTETGIFNETEKKRVCIRELKDFH